MNFVLAGALGAAAGVLAGLFGVGGGILFVPVLVGLGLTQHEANGTSLLAILPTVIAGTWTQQRFGNLRWRAATVIGVAAAAAAQGGAFLAEALPNETLRKLFAAVLVVAALQILWRSRRKCHDGASPKRGSSAREATRTHADPR